jgi:hypothetical protein
MWPFANNKSKLAAPDVQAISKAEVAVEQGPVRRRSSAETEQQDVPSTILRPSKSLSSLKLAPDPSALRISPSAAVQQSSEVFAHGEFFTPPPESEDHDHAVPQSTGEPPVDILVIADQDVLGKGKVMDGPQGHANSTAEDEVLNVELPATDDLETASRAQSSAGEDSQQQIPPTPLQESNSEPLVNEIRGIVAAQTESPPSGHVMDSNDFSSIASHQSASTLSLRAGENAAVTPESDGKCLPTAALVKLCPESCSGESAIPTCSAATSIAGQKLIPIPISAHKVVNSVPEIMQVPTPAITADTPVVHDAFPLSDNTERTAAMADGKPKNHATRNVWLLLLLRRRAAKQKTRLRMFVKSGTKRLEKKGNGDGPPVQVDGVGEIGRDEVVTERN